MNWPSVIVILILGLVSGGLVTAVYFLDHPPKHEKKKWWEE